MTKNRTSVPCPDAVGSACTGALVGAAAASVHQVYLALSSQIPDNVFAHVFGETAAAAIAGAAVFAVGSAFCNWVKRRS